LVIGIWILELVFNLYLGYWLLPRWHQSCIDVKILSKSGGFTMPGKLPEAVLTAVLAALPIDITFVDQDDIIRYYSEYRIFKRTPDILGTSVQSCHSSASQRQVKAVLDDLKSGRRATVQMWAEKDGRQVSVRYMAVRGKTGEYLGMVEAAEWAAEPPR
jgi:uncharacterized protein